MIRFLYIGMFLLLSWGVKAQRVLHYSDTSLAVGDFVGFKMEFGKCWGNYLSSDEIPDIDSMVYFLKLNPELVVEVSSHTDARGDSLANFQLSVKRAQSVKDALVIRGIEPSRVEFVGYGENKPVKVDSAIHKKYSFLEVGKVLDAKYIQSLKTLEQQEIAYSINRRNQLKVIKTWKPFFEYSDLAFFVGQERELFIVYDLSGGWSIRPESIKVLDTLVQFLNCHPEMEFEIGFHTDSRGDSSMNKITSEGRALATAKYMQSVGANTSQFVCKGYGEEFPVFVNKYMHRVYPFLGLGRILDFNYVSKFLDVFQKETAYSKDRRVVARIVRIKE